MVIMTAPYIFSGSSIPLLTIFPLSDYLSSLWMHSACSEAMSLLASKLTMIPTAKLGAVCTAEHPSLRLFDCRC